MRGQINDLRFVGSIFVIQEMCIRDRGSITSQEYMDKLEHFVRVRTAQVEQSNYQYALRQFFDAAAANYKSKPMASRRGGKS